MALPPFDPASEPLGSTSPLVREVNSKLLDLGMHSKEDTFTDRFGEEKMTWEAMQNERIGLLIAGGQIFPTEAEGRAAAENGWYFYAVSPDPNVTRSLYRRISASESEHVKDDPSAEFVGATETTALGSRQILHGQLTYQYYDRYTSSWVISHDELSLFLGATRGQITIPAASGVIIPLNRMYYVDVADAVNGDSVTAEVSYTNANLPDFGEGGFVNDLKIPLFSFRAGGPGGMLLNKALDQDYNWPKITPTWFKTSAATRVIYDADASTLEWTNTIVCPISLASFRRAITLNAHTVSIPEGNYNVVWLDMRAIPNDSSSSIDVSNAIKVGPYSEGFSSDAAYRALPYQIPLFLVGFGTVRSAAGFFEGEVEGVAFNADTSELEAQLVAIDDRIQEVEIEIASIEPTLDNVSQSPLTYTGGVLSRFGAVGAVTINDFTPNEIVAPPYWRGKGVITAIDKPTLSNVTPVAISVDGSIVHPCADELLGVIIGHGQSNAKGSRGNVGPAIPLAARYNPHRLMFDGGEQMDVRLGLASGDFDTPIEPSVLTGFQPLRSVDTPENSGTTMMEGGAETIHRQLDKQLSLLSDYLYYTAARGGTSMSGLSEGTVPYQNLIIALERANVLAAQIGKKLWVPALWWAQGESDTVNFEYAEQLIDTVYNPVNAAIKSVTGQINDVQMFVIQPSSFQSFQAILGLREAAATNPNIHLVGASYSLPWSADYLHQNRAGQFGIGEYMARATLNVCFGDNDWRPLEPVAATLTSSTTIDIEFHVPVGSLVLDGEATDKDGNWGFQVVGNGAFVGITDRQLNGNTVTLTVDTPLTAGNASVRYALDGQSGPRTAEEIPRGRLRDSGASVSLVDSRPLYNWCVHFEEAL